ncbi:hypothetical protein MTBSS4_690005 [Magnetospirillum sp. SS-4]|nr:hypothetical protein MTBSS4_690005 [Magnetospirillum sp. SS-4]
MVLLIDIFSASGNRRRPSHLCLRIHRRGTGSDILVVITTFDLPLSYGLGNYRGAFLAAGLGIISPSKRPLVALHDGRTPVRPMEDRRSNKCLLLGHRRRDRHLQRMAGDGKRKRGGYARVSCHD